MASAGEILERLAFSHIVENDNFYAPYKKKFGSI